MNEEVNRVSYRTCVYGFQAWAKETRIRNLKLEQDDSNFKEIKDLPYETKGIYIETMELFNQKKKILF